MATLIPQNFINEVLERTDIVEIIDGRVTLRKTGRNYSGLCPFHQEKTPSFSVNPDKQFYYCFGCGAGGNAIGFLMEFERLDFRESVQQLARKAGLEIPQEAANEQQHNQALQPLFAALGQAQNWYQRQLKNHPQSTRAIAYLKQRGISGEIAREFALGYAPPGWDNLLNAQAQTPEQQKLLSQAGLLVQRDDKSGYYDRFRDRVIFPIRDTRGRTIAFGGRVFGDEKPKYLNSPESPVFHKGQELYGLYEARQASSRLTRFLIVEGYMDVIALAQHEINFAVATLGTATSEAHLRKLFRLAPELIFCFDGDNAGRQAAARALETALPVMEDGRQVRFLFLPEGEDPDSLVRQEGSQAFLNRLDQAMPLPEHFFAELGRQADLGSLDGKARLSKLALPLMQRMPRGALYQLMLDRLGQLTGLGQETLRNLSGQAETRERRAEQEAGSAPRTRTKTSHRRQPPVDNFARRAIKILLQVPALAQSSAPESLAELDASQNPELQQDQDLRLLLDLLSLLGRQPQLSTAVILSHWHGKPEYLELVSLAAHEKLLDQETLAVEFKDTLRLLLARRLEAEIDRMLEAVRAGTASPEQKHQLNELLRRRKFAASGSNPP